MEDIDNNIIKFSDVALFAQNVGQRVNKNKRELSNIDRDPLHDNTELKILHDLSIAYESEKYVIAFFYMNFKDETTIMDSVKFANGLNLVVHEDEYYAKFKDY